MIIRPSQCVQAPPGSDPVCALIDAAPPIAQVARELGLDPETFRTWIRQDEADLGELGARSARGC